ncbi:hypothetical protein NMR92_003775 [Vibrio cholerae]|nr:hypothetical protein [Vibrio cholerae]EJL6644937.1 hypothetical protein [Vibrio cholerae]
MVSVVVIEFSGMRCQPLRRALELPELPVTMVPIRHLGYISCYSRFLLRFESYERVIELYHNENKSISII